MIRSKFIKVLAYLARALLPRWLLKHRTVLSVKALLLSSDADTAKSVAAAELRVTPSVKFLESLGYEFDLPAIRRQLPEPQTPEAPPAWPSEQLYFVTVCSMNHVAYARTLLKSLIRHHGAIAFIVTVVDAPTRDSVKIDGATILTGADVFGADLDYAALKFDASQLCCAAKPHMLDYLLRHTRANRFVYVDCDIYAFAPFDALIKAIDGSNFVVSPHTFNPLPAPERFWERPSLGDLLHAGVFNAGLFGMRRTEASTEFISVWKSLVTGPGAFVTGQGGQAEQQAFNWVSTFVDSVTALRDRAYNVAYWNLHDRSLRYVDRPNGGSWTVDGKPLVSFHYSGYSPRDPFRLSIHDNRYNLYNLPAVARLCDFYTKRVSANDHGELETEYSFDSAPSGIRINRFMREIFRTHEVFMRAQISPWTAEGEAHYVRALLSPIPYTGSLAPILMKQIYDTRPDLSVLGDISFDPRRLIAWMFSSGIDEYGYRELFARHRPTIPTFEGAVLLSSVCEKWPHLLNGLDAAVRHNRDEFVGRLQNIASVEAQKVHLGETEYYLISPISSVRRFIEQRADLVQAFPNFLFDDAPKFVDWLRESRMKEHYLPLAHIDAFAARTGGRSLARIFSYFSRSWSLMERWPLALAGVGSLELARVLMANLRHSIEFDLNDVEMFLWTVDVNPQAGVALTLELPIHTTRHPSSRSRRGQDEILRPLLTRDKRFAVALAQYRRRYRPIEDHAVPSQRTEKDVSVHSYIGSSARRIERTIPVRIAPGANVFGYHRSDIGLGQMSRGLVKSLETIGCRTSSIILSNVRMDDDLEPEDFIQKYDRTKGTNIFVSYPHMPVSLLRTVPNDVLEGHRNISYLAWEQRDGSPYWKDIYGEYDQVWALSDFAAESLTSILQRTVHSVPCVVDTNAFPPPANKERQLIDPSLFLFLFIYDANSSTERKNPDAVVEAFRAAFRADDRVRLIIKAGSADRTGNRARLQRLRGAVRSQPNIEIRHADLSRPDLYGLISACDCYVSLHRGEGFGYTCAEAMAYGKPVIATGYSGNMQFMNKDNSYPVRFKEVESNIQEGPFQRGSLWAEPDVKHAAELMRHVYECRDEAAAKGALGRDTVAQQLSPAAIGDRVRQLLSEVPIV